MPGFLLHFGATVLCSHAGQAQPTAPNPRVMVNGTPTVTLAAPYVVVGCALPPPPAANGPCVTAQFVTAATQFLVQGALQQWLGDLIQVDAVQVESEDSAIRVVVQYTVRRTQQRQVAQFARGGAGR